MPLYSYNNIIIIVTNPIVLELCLLDLYILTSLSFLTRVRT